MSGRSAIMIVILYEWIEKGQWEVATPDCSLVKVVILPETSRCEHLSDFERFINTNYLMRGSWQ